MDKKVRVRFAPSPTGNIHIGNVRTAVLNWLCARHFGGDFILRIEDTDAERSTADSEQGILDQLTWLGLDWDEGPLKGGKYGPYRQSERTQTYSEHVDKLIAEGKAYRCFCSVEEIESEKSAALDNKENWKYSRKCMTLSDDEKDKFRSDGRGAVVRFKVPEETILLKDLVQGNITFEASTFSDFIIQREDGTSPYNFACVLDDALMCISHVIRGNDHVSNTPKQIMIYRALGYNVPEFAHIPMITGQDGVRLSKRHGHSSVSEFRSEGYLPQALINYLSLLSWSSKTGDEVLTKDRLIGEFDLSRVNKSPAAFDIVKLGWLNGVHYREMDLAEREKISKPYLENAGYDISDENRFSKIIEAAKNNVEKLTDLSEHAAIFFKDELLIEGKEEKELLGRETSQKVFNVVAEKLENIDELTVNVFQSVMKEVQKETGVKGKDLWMPVRVALTGQMHGPELPVVLEIFGKEKCLKLFMNVIT